MISKALQDIAAERERQVARENWSPEHDDQHTGGELALAAACYAIASVRGMNANRYGNRADWIRGFINNVWPWSASWWRPSGDLNRRRDLEKAGALIAAEIERLDRASARIKTIGG